MLPLDMSSILPAGYHYEDGALSIGQVGDIKPDLAARYVIVQQGVCACGGFVGLTTSATKIRAHGS